MRINLRQRGVVAGFFSNLAIVLVGFGLADQPVMTLPMTWSLRAGIMLVSLGFLAGSIRLERTRGRR